MFADGLALGVVGRVEWAMVDVVGSGRRLRVEVRMAKHNFRMWAALESAGLTIRGLASIDPRDSIAITVPTSCFLGQRQRRR